MFVEKRAEYLIVPINHGVKITSCKVIKWRGGNVLTEFFDIKIPKFTIFYTLVGWSRAREINVAKHASVIRGQFKNSFHLWNKVISTASDDKIQSASITVSWTVNMLLKTSLSAGRIIYMKIEIVGQNELVGCSDKFFKKFRELGKELRRREFVFMGD